MRKKNRFKLEAKAKKGSASGPSLSYRILSWVALFTVILSAFWFWSAQWGTDALISEPEKKLRELSRENPNAEIFDVHPEKSSP